MSTSTVVQVSLFPEDIDGAVISKPYDKQTTAALRWWLLCKGIKLPNILEKEESCGKVCVVSFCWDFI